MKFKKWEIALLMAVVILILSGFKINKDAENLSEKLIRIHVVANSDEEYDQELKLKVRDSVIEFIEPLLENTDSREAAEEVIKTNMSAILDKAKDTICKNNFSYDVSGILTQEYFPTVDYETFSLPAGEYNSLRIIIGEGNGHNWWCVIFPSLCTAAMVNSENENMLTDAEAALITEKNTEYIIKFKIAEIIGELKHSLLG